MKNIVYSVTRTNAMNVGDAEILAVTPVWKTALYTVVCVFWVLTAAAAVLALGRKKKNKAVS